MCVGLFDSPLRLPIGPEASFVSWWTSPPRAACSSRSRNSTSSVFFISPRLFPGGSRSSSETSAPGDISTGNPAARSIPVPCSWPVADLGCLARCESCIACVDKSVKRSRARSLRSTSGNMGALQPAWRRGTIPGAVQGGAATRSRIRPATSMASSAASPPTIGGMRVMTHSATASSSSVNCARGTTFRLWTSMKVPKMSAFNFSMSAPLCRALSSGPLPNCNAGPGLYRTASRDAKSSWTQPSVPQTCIFRLVTGLTRLADRSATEPLANIIRAWAVFMFAENGDAERLHVGHRRTSRSRTRSIS